MRALSRWLGPLVVLGAVASTRPAEAVIVEKVVAVVADQAIFLSDLRHRAKPMLVQIAERVPAGPQRGAVESEMYRELLQQMVDERLVQLAADRAQRRVSAEEIDRGMAQIAASQGYTTDELVARAIESGLTPQELRLQVMRQLLEQKMVSLRVMPRVRISPEDVKAGYARLVRDERKRLAFSAQWIIIRVMPGSSPEARRERRELADTVVGLARQPTADFAALARTYSDDADTRAKGGALPPLKPGQLAAELDAAALTLGVGDVSAPISYGGDFAILKIVARDKSALPPLEDAHERVASEVFSERLQKARRQWLDELKRGIYVDVRM
ncbi:MAG: peptidylprolyl isomerase [Polyangiaceae bacterium]|nr:peptidylprolyl isomerase [Polyangiaceae bacterium]